MLDISGGELLVIGVIALVVIGPKELPGLIRTAGNAMSKVRRMAAEFRGQFDDAMREAELDQAKKAFDDVKDVANSVKPAFNPLDTIRNEIQSVKDEIRTAKDAGDKPAVPLPEPKFDPPPPAPPIDIKADLAREQAAKAAAPPPPAPPASPPPAVAEPAPETKPKRSRKKADGASA
jgi:sec-independent protein translocase protein TatB